MAAQFMTGGGGEPDDNEGNVDDDDDDSEGNNLFIDAEFREISKLSFSSLN